MHRPSVLRSRQRVLLVLPLACCLLCWPTPSRAQFQPQLNEIVTETQKTSQDANNFMLVWWVPKEYWAVAMQSNPNVNQEQIDEMLGILGAYTMVAVVQADIGPMGGMDFTTAEVMRGQTTIEDVEGDRYTPIPSDKIDPDTQNLLGALQPIMRNAAGPTGENMHFMLFPARSEDGRLIADATSEGRLVVHVADREANFRLPLGSLMPPKYDPQTDEEFPGNYQYNPFTGAELVTASPQ